MSQLVVCILQYAYVQYTIISQDFQAGGGEGLIQEIVDFVALRVGKVEKYRLFLDGPFFIACFGRQGGGSSDPLNLPDYGPANTYNQ